jgi:aromatase
VRVNSARVSEVLGADADVLTAQETVRKALSGNSLTTLHAAKAYAEGSGGRRAAS